MEINGWKVYFYSCFISQLTPLYQAVAALKANHQDNYHKKRQTKLLAAYVQVIERIASDPLGSQFRQGDTLGVNNKNWFRAKFLQQYRLFYRCSEQHKAIVIGWVNDENTLRAYGSKTDAYKIFEAMLKLGDPPSDWDTLLARAKTDTQAMPPELFEGF
nr:type II toxin-antitoxin system YhaV family toxin [Winslowiella toletana]